TEFIADKARPHSDGRVLPEEILLRFRCTSKQSLFPAEPKLENIRNPIIRQQYRDIANTISKTADPIIIHASGGVGKSILAAMLSSLLPKDSIVIVYDCFGMGEYRNRSRPRHRYRDCLVQIANELAVDDLCSPLIAESTALDDQILNKFLDRLDVAIKRIRKLFKDGNLYIVIDAADNAEMAAEENDGNNKSCFAHALLREKMPEFCHLVMLCRTERVELLNPISSVKKIELLPFDEEESLNNIKRYFSNARKEDGLEFHRLTGGNPRVQANALESGCENVQEVLNWLGPDGSTVETQLEKIFQGITDNQTDQNKQRITEICYGMAILPPFVPIDVLASAAGVKRSDVTSFIADFGKAIWLTDSYIQFRDEPTETWFRNSFIGSKDRAEKYITKLKPLAEEYVYVAQVLPVLLLQGQYFDQLIELALSDRYLPEINAVEKRNVRTFRLKFAFKAALQKGRYCDAAKLAMLAGEETAGSSRQLEVFKKNIDLVAKLLDVENIQQLAYSKQIKALWDGSENIYTSLLLSSIS
ncbi:MAG: ATP-binding protein, partial [Bacillota bacterium]